jgi:Starch-binding associating with outer membrane
MKINKIVFGITMMTGLVMATACEDALDINTDPNNPANSTPQLTLPAAQVGLATTLESQFNILGSILAHYWTQGPTASQYSGIEQYNITTSNYVNAWQSMYAGGAGGGIDTGVLSDLKFVKTAALAQGLNNYAAVAQLLQVYTFQILVDLYDQVPYSEALRGKEGILAPRFEDGAVIYDDLIVKIDEAMGWINANAPTPGNDDLIFGGNMNLWTRFANTLKLKIYIRQALARPAVAQAGIAALYATNPQFLGSDQHALISFSANTGNENPIWQELDNTTPTNVVASLSSTQRMLDVSDSRLTALYDPAPTGGQYTGLRQGTGTTDGGQYNNYARPDAAIILTRAAPVILMSGYESMFLQAEAAQRGWSSGNAKALYDAAVLASFSFWGQNGAAFITPTGSYAFNNTLDQIYYQKWLSFNGKQGYEGWTEWRRTGVPVLPRSVQGAPLGNTFPLRLIWPTNETSSNPNAPTVRTVDTPVWWDTTL